MLTRRVGRDSGGYGDTTPPGVALEVAAFEPVEHLLVLKTNHRVPAMLGATAIAAFRIARRSMILTLRGFLDDAERCLSADRRRNLKIRYATDIIRPARGDRKLGGHRLPWQKRMFAMKRSPDPHLLTRTKTFAVFACIFLSPSLSANSALAANLDFSTRDVFPVSRADLGFPGDPRAVLLAQASPDLASDSAWETASPPTDEFDWLQTTSGEWLKGELKELYSGSVQFDSDELGLQRLDWESVAQFRGHGVEQLSIDTEEGPVTIVGVLTVTKDTISVKTDEGVREFERGQLISITPGASTEWDNWSFKVTFGLGILSGNTDQTDFTAKANIRRKTPENRFVLDYLGNFSESDNQQTVNNHRVNTFYDLFLAREYFLRPIFAEYFRDTFQNIEYRATVGVGAGYQIIDTPETTWDVSGGPAYRATKYVSVQPGQSQTVDTPALVAGTYFETTLTSTVDFNLGFDFSLVNQESGTYTQHAIATFEIALTDILDFDISFVWDRTQDPQPRSDGTVPKRDDFQLLLTFGVDI